MFRCARLFGNRLIPGIVALIVSGVLASLCRGGEEIEHRHMIYALAITAGYSPAQAKVVADASWSMDKNNSTLATPDGYLDDSLAIARVAMADERYRKQLLTRDEALDEAIFNSKGLLSRVGPSAFIHSLMKDPRARDDANAPGLDLVYRQYIADQTNQARRQGLSEGDVKKVQLILVGQYLHQMVDSFVHPHDAVLGHGLEVHAPDLAPHNEKQFTQAAFKALATLRVMQPQIGPADKNRMQALGLETTEKQLDFCKNLVNTMASSYDLMHRAAPDKFDPRETTARERVEANIHIQNFMNKFFEDRGASYQVTIPRFDKAILINRDGILELTYEGKKLATLDNVVDWVRGRDEYKDLVASVRQNVRSWMEKLDPVGGVMIHHDQQALFKILTGGDRAENAKRLADLDDRLKKEADPSERRKILTAFLQDIKTGFRAGQNLKTLDKLTVLSMKEVVTRAEQFAQRWNDLPAELRTPGNITRLHGFVISGDDILIVGRQEADAPALEIDDLIVGIRAVWKENTTPLVSLDPDPANLEGDPKARIQGIPQDSGFALTLLEADYAMKRIMAGIEPMDVPGYRTLKEILRDTNRTFMSRFWLYPVQPTTGDIQVSSGASSAIFLGGVQVLSEEMLLLKDGLVGTGQTFVPAEEAAQSFTSHYEAIAARQPMFRRLQGLFDVVLLARIWRVGGLESPLLERLCALPHRSVEIPQTYRAVRVLVRSDGNGAYYIHGGVQAKIGAGRRCWLNLETDDLDALRTQCASMGAGAVAGGLGDLSLRAALPSTRRDTSSRDFTAAATGLLRGDLKLAQEAVDRLVEADPWDGEALILRALIHLRRADYASARRDAHRARALDSGDRETAAAAGEILFQCRWMEGDPDGALRELEVGLRHDPHSANAQVARGSALVLLDKPEEARKALVKAVELDPASALACARLALLELGEGRTLAAKPWIKKALALDANLPEVRIASAHWELATVRPDLAEKIAREVWEKEANGPTARLRALAILAAVSASREKWQDVEKYIGQMDQLSARSPEVLLVAAEIAFTWGERQRGLDYLAKAEQLAPNHPLVLKRRSKLKK